MSYVVGIEKEKKKLWESLEKKVYQKQIHSL